MQLGKIDEESVESSSDHESFVSDIDQVHKLDAKTKENTPI